MVDAQITFQPGRRAAPPASSSTRTATIPPNASKRMPPRRRARRRSPSIPQLLDRYVGRYQLAPAFILTVTREGDRLFVQAPASRSSSSSPRREREFFIKVVDAQITFVTDVSGRATEVILHQNGSIMTAKRME